MSQREPDVKVQQPRWQTWITIIGIAIAGLLVVGGIITAMVLGIESCRHVAESSVKSPPCESGIVCENAYTVCQDYLTNIVQADSKYKDKTVRISGHIIGIYRDPTSGKAFVSLDGGSVNYVQCFFDAQNESLITGFAPRDLIWIQGTGGGWNYVPFFIHCDQAVNYSEGH